MLIALCLIYCLVETGLNMLLKISKVLHKSFKWTDITLDFTAKTTRCCNLLKRTWAVVLQAFWRSLSFYLAYKFIFILFPPILLHNHFQIIVFLFRPPNTSL